MTVGATARYHQQVHHRLVEQMKTDPILIGLRAQLIELMNTNPMVGMVSYKIRSEDACFEFPIYYEDVQRRKDKIELEITEYINSNYPQLVIKEIFESIYFPNRERIEGTLKAAP